MHASEELPGGGTQRTGLASRALPHRNAEAGEVTLTRIRKRNRNRSKEACSLV